MPKESSAHLQFSTLITKSRIYRRTLLDELNDRIKEDESKHQKARMPNWKEAGDIERQCEMLKQALTYF